jgi:hypothetical protein
MTASTIESGKPPLVPVRVLLSNLGFRRGFRGLKPKGALDNFHVDAFIRFTQGIGG